MFLVALYCGTLYNSCTPRAMTCSVYVGSINRDMSVLTRNPALYAQWISRVVNYIREKYGNPPKVHAIIVPDTRGLSFGIAVASELKLPYIAIHKVGEVSADSDDVIQATYINKKIRLIILF